MRRPSISLRSVWVAVLCLAAAGCSRGSLRDRLTAAGVYSPARNDTVPQAMIDLGQLLFFDPELSGNRDVACSSCHLPVDHAGDGLPLGRSEGATGAGHNRHGGHALPRNTPSPFNRSFATALFWDGRIERMPDGTLRAPVALPDGIETPGQAQALMPLITRDEMRGQDGDLDVNGAPNELARIADDDPAAVWDGVMARLMAIPGYRDAFEAAFPDVPAGEHTIAHAVRAIERFEMHLWELTDTPFDRYLGSEESPPNDRELSAEAQRGALLFFGPAGCDRCHDGPLLSDGSYHNIGVFPVGMDEGRFVVTSNPNDRFAFRTPPLRNVALTGPYMHDGAVETLADAIHQHIAPGETLDQGLTLPDGTPVSVDAPTADAIRATIDPDVRPLRSLNSDELAALVAFLQALSSDTEATGLPPFAGEPTSVPSGLAVQGSRGP